MSISLIKEAMGDAVFWTEQNLRIYTACSNTLSLLHIQGPGHYMKVIRKCLEMLKDIYVDHRQYGQQENQLLYDIQYQINRYFVWELKLNYTGRYQEPSVFWFSKLAQK